jgi:hypothetical protein
MLIGSRRAILGPLVSLGGGGGPTNLLLAAEPPTLHAGDSTWDQPTRTINSPNANAFFWRWTGVLPTSGNARFQCDINMIAGSKIRIQDFNNEIIWISGVLSVGVSHVDSGLFSVAGLLDQTLNIVADTATFQGTMSAFSLTTS